MTHTPVEARESQRQRLRGAAPDMLAALKIIANFDGSDLDDLNTGYNQSLRDIARAAIAKAEGK